MTQNKEKNRELLSILRQYELKRDDRNERVAEWRDYLESCGEKARFRNLEQAWQTLSNSDDTLELYRDDMVCDEPLAALFFHVENGLYPPPELLLTAADMFRMYINGKGAISLEEVFFGQPTRNAGTYAARSVDEYNLYELALELFRKRNSKAIQLEIAERHIQKYQLHIESESLLRAYRRWDKTRAKGQYKDK